MIHLFSYYTKFPAMIITNGIIVVRLKISNQTWLLITLYIAHVHVPLLGRQHDQISWELRVSELVLTWILYSLFSVYSVSTEM